MTAWLDSIEEDERIADAFIESLAVGSESGTLRSRYRSMDLRGATIQAKTGYINGVSCLSGYITAEPDSHRPRRIAFSVLVNGFAAGGGRTRSLSRASS